MSASLICTVTPLLVRRKTPASNKPLQRTSHPIDTLEICKNVPKRIFNILLKKITRNNLYFILNTSIHLFHELFNRVFYSNILIKEERKLLFIILQTPNEQKHDNQAENSTNVGNQLLIEFSCCNTSIQTDNRHKACQADIHKLIGSRTNQTIIYLYLRVSLLCQCMLTLKNKLGQ